MEGRPTWTDCDEAGDYVVSNVLSTRDLVSRPDNMEETVPHTCEKQRRRSSAVTVQLNSAFGMALLIVQSVYLINPRYPAFRFF